jgi:O-antigen/teichoic acid export membrane protein
MRTAFLWALWSAIGFAVASAGLAAFYYLHARPMWSQPERHQMIEKVLRDPNTPADIVRKTALEGHNVIAKSYLAVDSALQLLLIFGFGAAIVLAYLAYLIRKNAKDLKSAP